MYIISIISGALMFSVVQVALIGHFFFGPLPETSAPSLGELLQNSNVVIFVGICVGVLVMSFVVPKILLKGALKSLPDKTSFTLEKDLLPRYFSSHIVRFAMLESIAILGLIMTTMTHNTMLVVGNSAVSLVIMALFFPTASKIQSQIQASTTKKIRLH